jgi:hypothetical protein
MAGGDQFFCYRANLILVDVRQCYCSSRLREGFGGRQTDARGGTSHKCDFIGERPVQFTTLDVIDHLRGAP